MTEKLYLKDMKMKEFDATVVKLDGNSVYLDRTAFYPTGGGQPNDIGKLVFGNGELQIVDVKKDGDDVVHTVQDANGLKEGDSVHGIIDWDTRYAYMKYHTALHLVDAVTIKSFSSNGIMTGGQIYKDRARMDFDMPTLNKELGQQIIDKANEEILNGRRVLVKEISRDEALKIPDLARTAPGRELINRLERVRIVEIEGLDSQADGGLHVDNIKELGKIVLNGYKNNGAHSKRIEIRLE